MDRAGDVMEVSLAIAKENDAKLIFDIQVKAFMPLLDKYEDYETNPANETLKQVTARINNPDGDFYKILADNELVGAICVFWKEEVQFWISPMFILPSHQGNGIAQEAIILIEEMFPQANTWELSTILEEKLNCNLYEKMGYRKTGHSEKLNNKTTLIAYKKYV